jgi:UDP-N-acetylglucosamine 2-epimerase (non-hydrolysing)
VKKVLLIFGTRPEAIKLCPLVNKLKQYEEGFKTVVCVTAQHREMLDQVLRLFDVIPDYDLNVMKKDQSLFDVTSRCLTETGRIIKGEKPDLVIVQGDTTTTFAGALAAYYHKVKVAHVEAGLRTNNKDFPYPEEANRKLTSVLADVHFAPTDKARNNLLNEGISRKDIMVTGNTVIDALLWVRDKVKNERKRFERLDLLAHGKRIVLVTGHRREHFGQEFANVCGALKKIAQRNNDIVIVYPVHMNPNINKPARKILNGIENIKLIDPLTYEEFIYLMEKSYFVISDSGGIQEEAPSLGKPVLVTRTTTERPEAVEAGAVKLVGTDKRTIINEASRLLHDPKSYQRMSRVRNPYGDGKASLRIIKKLRKL